MRLPSPRQHRGLDGGGVEVLDMVRISVEGFVAPGGAHRPSSRAGQQVTFWGRGQLPRRTLYPIARVLAALQLGCCCSTVLCYYGDWRLIYTDIVAESWPTPVTPFANWSSHATRLRRSMGLAWRVRAGWRTPASQRPRWRSFHPGDSRGAATGRALRVISSRLRVVVILSVFQYRPLLCPAYI